MFHVQEFKYILCYGSSNSHQSTFELSLHLNTSYVMVHQVKKIAKKAGIDIFKYILCYGSSPKGSLESLLSVNLNTSYVMVHPFP